MRRLPAPTLNHLAALTDSVSVFEHALFNEPRREVGYCTDDAGRLLALASRMPWDPHAKCLAENALRFLRDAYIGQGVFRLRLGGDGRWTHHRPSDDANGRALYGLGVAAISAPWPHVRYGSFALFCDASVFRSPFRRANAYAALGAAAIVRVYPTHQGARRLLSDATLQLSQEGTQSRWLWPEETLTYANALIPEARLAIAMASGDGYEAKRAVAMLRWLVQIEHPSRRFSFTPTGGRTIDNLQSGFDQQPIEASAMADAALRAYVCTKDNYWLSVLYDAAEWFVGANDLGIAVFDPSTGGGFDGLRTNGVNENQGAESTICFVSVMERVNELTANYRIQDTASSRSIASRRGTDAMAAPT
jgi:hypothetical protein